MYKIRKYRITLNLRVNEVGLRVRACNEYLGCLESNETDKEKKKKLKTKLNVKSKHKIKKKKKNKNKKKNSKKKLYFFIKNANLKYPQTNLFLVTALRDFNAKLGQWYIDGFIFNRELINK